LIPLNDLANKEFSPLGSKIRFSRPGGNREEGILSHGIINLPWRSGNTAMTYVSGVTEATKTSSSVPRTIRVKGYLEIPTNRNIRRWIVICATKRTEPP